MNARHPSVKLNLQPLQALRREIAAGGTFGGRGFAVRGGGGASGGAMQAMYREWGRRVLAYWRDLFRRNRAGGGDWPPLKADSALNRRNRVGILHVTGVLFDALRPGKPGNIFQVSNGGVAVGIGGPAKHAGSDLTIGEIALIHHRGAGHCPVRTIFYPPDETLRRLMREDARRTVQRILRANARR